MKNHVEIGKLKFLLLLPAGMLLVKLAAISPYLTEHIYSRGIYRVISQVLSAMAGWLPFSTGEFVIAALVLFLIAALIRGGIRIFRSEGRGRLLLNWVLNILVFISILYFTFVITFDINYQRLPFSTITGMDVRPAGVDELYGVCESLTEHANNLRVKVKEDPNGVMVLSDSTANTLKKASAGYRNATVTYPVLGGNYSRPKEVFFSEVMSMMGIQGIHNPLTQEANINTGIPDCFIPSTACHEMAHQRGFAREDEANYIAYLTCKSNPDPDFQYSGELMALVYSMNALHEADTKRFEQLRRKYSPGMVRDLKANSEFWRKFEGPVQNISDTVNDAYLKANNQKDGIRSYGRMVDLLIAQYRKTGPGGM